MFMHQPTTVIVVADKTSLKRPFIFFNGVNMALSFILLAITVAAHRHLSDNNNLEEFGLSGVVKLYILGSACLLLSFIGVCGALKENKWCLIVFAVGMAAASQMMIVNTAIKYQPVYEKEVLNREAAFLSMMPLSGASKNNRTLMDGIQQYYKCCGLVEGYPDWGSSIPSSCVCELPRRYCARLQGNVTVGTARSKNEYVYREPCLHIYMASVKRAFSIVTGFKFGSAMFWGVLLVLSIKLMVQIKKKRAFLDLLQTQMVSSKHTALQA